MKQKYERDKLLEDLKMNVLSVFFTKVNGEKREMRCTLMPMYLPPNYVPEHLDEEHKKPGHENVIACWDVLNAGWRSFRIDNVEYVQVLDAYQY